MEEKTQGENKAQDEENKASGEEQSSATEGSFESVEKKDLTEGKEKEQVVSQAKPEGAAPEPQKEEPVSVEEDDSEAEPAVTKPAEVPAAEQEPSLEPKEQASEQVSDPEKAEEKKEPELKTDEKSESAIPEKAAVASTPIDEGDTDTSAEVKEEASAEEETVNDTREVFDEHDMEENKVFAVLAYISILCLIPLFLKKDSKFAGFHARQGLLVFIFTVLSVILIEILKAVSPYTLWRIWNLVGNLAWLAIIIFSVIGIAHVLQKKAEPLPLIGHLADEVADKLNI